MENTTYDYIIAGAGLSGLLLAYQMSKSIELDNKTIGIIDPSVGHNPEKNFSFWSTNKPDLLNHIDYKQWDQVQFSKGNKLQRQDIHPYNYYTIKSDVLFTYLKTYLKKKNKISFIADHIEEIQAESQTCITKSGQYRYNLYCFDSHFTPATLPYENKKPFIWQHFLGYEVNFQTPCINPEVVTYMDMNVPQPKSGLAFMYILPYSSTNAFFEFTYFSGTLYEEEHYKSLLEDYIKKRYSESFEIRNLEKGKIPMSTEKLQYQKDSIVPIGTKAGLVKASTGYSFLRNLENAKSIVKKLEKQELNLDYIPKTKFRLYDDTLIDILQHGTLSGRKIFEELLSNNDMQRVFKFLDEETSLVEDLSIMNSVPKIQFTKAFIKQLA